MERFTKHARSTRSSKRRRQPSTTPEKQPGWRIQVEALLEPVARALALQNPAEGMRPLTWKHVASYARERQREEAAAAAAAAAAEAAERAVKVNPTITFASPTDSDTAEPASVFLAASHEAHVRRSEVPGHSGKGLFATVELVAGTSWPYGPARSRQSTLRAT